MQGFAALFCDTIGTTYLYFMKKILSLLSIAGMLLPLATPSQVMAADDAPSLTDAYIVTVVGLEAVDQNNVPNENVRTFKIELSHQTSELSIELYETTSDGDFLHTSQTVTPGSDLELTVSPEGFDKTLSDGTSYRYIVKGTRASDDEQTTTTGEFVTITFEEFAVTVTDMDDTDDSGADSDSRRTFGLTFSEPVSSISIDIYDVETDELYTSGTEEIDSDQLEWSFRPKNFSRTLRPNTAYRYLVTVTSLDGIQTASALGSFTTGNYFHVDVTSVDPKEEDGSEVPDGRAFSIHFSHQISRLEVLLYEGDAKEPYDSFITETDNPTRDWVIYPARFTRRLQPSTTYRYEVRAAERSIGAQALFEGEFTTQDFDPRTLKPEDPEPRPRPLVDGEIFRPIDARPTDTQEIIDAREALRDRIEHLGFRETETDQAVITRELDRVKDEDPVLRDRLIGHVLIQPEENGEAWYVAPETKERFYLRDGEAAYTAMNAFGLGVSEEDIEKIPIGVDEAVVKVDTDQDGLDDKMEEAIGTDPTKADSDGDGFDDKTEVKNGYNPKGEGRMQVNADLQETTKGRIILQTQREGQAWYVNPEDGKRYYMRDGDAAYSVMRNQSLGVSNEDLAAIKVGRFVKQ